MLFEKMDEADVKILFECLKPRVHKFSKNEIVNSEGDPFEGIGIVLSGQAAVVKETASGNRAILTMLKPGELFGEMAAFSGNGKWPATVIAQSPCSIIYIPPNKILGQCERACSGHRMLILNMLSILSRKAMTLSRKLEYLSIKSLRGRIARFLLEQHGKSGQATFMIAMNRNELADFLNVSRPSLSRELCRMRDDGLVDFHRSSLQLKDIDQLRILAE
jgi:CRP-like cAMP-binding protein